MYFAPTFKILNNMYIPFEQLTNEAKVWVYPADKKLSFTTADAILQEAKNFLDHWKSHDRPLTASAKVADEYFLIIGMEKPTFPLTCCTTDNITRFLQQIKEKWHIDFFKRDKLRIRHQNEDILLPITEVKKQLEAGLLDKEAIFFDHTINQKAALAQHWTIPLHQAWFYRETDKMS